MRIYSTLIGLDQLIKELMALKTKTIVFAWLLVAVPMAEAQTAGLIGALLGLIRVQGTLFCTPNGNVGLGGLHATPVFPNASVQLQCGAGNEVSSSVTTNGSGMFSILLDPLHFIPSLVLSGCKLVVTTPLATCNARLPRSGVLTSPLMLVGTTVLRRLLNIVNMLPLGFTFTP